jgi:hypothetical protein
MGKPLEFHSKVPKVLRYAGGNLTPLLGHTIRGKKPEHGRLRSPYWLKINEYIQLKILSCLRTNIPHSLNHPVELNNLLSTQPDSATPTRASYLVTLLCIHSAFRLLLNDRSFSYYTGNPILWNSLPYEFHQPWRLNGLSILLQLHFLSFLCLSLNFITCLKLFGSLLPIHLRSMLNPRPDCFSAWLLSLLCVFLSFIASLLPNFIAFIFLLRPL